MIGFHGSSLRRAEHLFPLVTQIYMRMVSCHKRGFLHVHMGVEGNECVEDKVAIYKAMDRSSSCSRLSLPFLGPPPLYA